MPSSRNQVNCQEPQELSAGALDAVGYEMAIDLLLNYLQAPAMNLAMRKSSYR